jgi:hemolysin III
MDKAKLFNIISHLAGTILAIGGTALLVVMAAIQRDPWKIVSFSLYGTTLIMLYLFSTLYHSVRGGSNVVLQKFDHIAIYLLIAGSYTPFTLVTLRGPLGWTLFGAIWGIAALGIGIDVLLANKRRIIPVIFYILMGWLVVFALKPLLRALPLNGFWWLLAGGVSYTAGIAFYALEGKLPYSHGIWHLFVLCGSITQFIAVFLYVL